MQGLDVGPETVKIYAAAVARAKTILWNGYVLSLFVVSSLED